MRAISMFLATGTAAAALVFALFGGVATAAKQGPGGNSDAAKACQKTGYQDWVREDGSAFETSKECTAYAAEGGTLQPKPTFASVCTAVGGTFTAVGDDGGVCEISGVGGPAEFAILSGLFDLLCPLEFSSSFVEGGISSWTCTREPA
jgi:hypothetical protein